MITLKKLILLFICCLGCSLMGQEGHKILKDSLKASKKLSYSASLKNPLPEKEVEEIILPYASNWKFYRKFDGSNIFLRLELFDSNNNLQELYLKNNSGCYGSDIDEFNAQIINIPYLWMPELLNADIFPEELQACIVELADTEYDGILCYEITTKFSGDDKLLLKLSRDDLFWFDIYKDIYTKHRTYIRKFIIDKKTGLILARSHYNRSGVETFNVRLHNVEYIEPSSEKFKTPNNIQGVFVERNDFVSKRLEMMMVADTGKFNYFRKCKVALVTIASVIFLIFAIFIIMKKGRK